MVSHKNKKWKGYFLRSVIFITGCFLGIAGCSRKDSIANSPEPSVVLPVVTAITTTPSPKPATNIPTITISPTITLTLLPKHAPTQEATVTPEISPDVYQYECLNISQTLPSDIDLKGKMVLLDAERNPYIWDTHSQTSQYLDNAWSGVEISSDHSRILYQTDNEVIIADVNNHVIWSRSKEGIFYANWFDNDRLLTFGNTVEDLPLLILMNPFTGEQQELTSVFPGISKARTILWGFTRVIYDPTQTRVVYPFFDGENETSVALWNTETNQEIARIITYGFPAFGYEPVWFSNGERFIFVADVTEREAGDLLFHHELLSVSREGEFQVLTHFSNFFRQTEMNGGYRLSPDETQIAFWMDDGQGMGEGLQLAVLNMNTDQVTNYCISGAGYPVWSPDSTQLLVLTTEQEAYSTILVDLDQKIAALIAEETEPQGWMLAP